MKQGCAANNVDIRALALAGDQLAGQEPLAGFTRLVDEILADGTQELVVWNARFEDHPDATGVQQPWMHLSVSTSLNLTCQRCLDVVAVPVDVERSFRFVHSEQVAEAEDEQADEDVLALDKQFKLRDLIEDEVLMAMPLVPRHAACPGEVKLSAVDSDFEAAQTAKPRPFEVLAALKKATKR
jgi:uncharacterized protein